MKLREIPSVNTLLHAVMQDDIEIPRDYVVHIIRWELASIRKLKVDGKVPLDERQIVERIRGAVTRGNRVGMRRVINGTGIVLHTGLGRAPFSSALLKEVSGELKGYAALEIDLRSGKRGERLHRISPLLNSLTGASDSLVVNNNAAGVLLGLNTLAEGRDVVVSRGQLVEIGGLFRIPDVIGKSGANLVEVGTTNRTHLEDYANALTRDTGAVLVVHTSNYRIQGFTKEVSLAELAELCRKKRVPLMVDLGSGALFDLEDMGLPREPTVSHSLKQGADLVTFSGDKLLGGPQSGLVCGKRNLISRLRKNPLYRALRCDKMTIALLEHCLRSYRETPPRRENMTYRLLATSRRVLTDRAERLVKSLGTETVNKLGVTVVTSKVEAGSGSLPTETFESAALKFHSPTIKPSDLAERFRNCDPPVLGYSAGNRFYIDLKAVFPEQIKEIGRAMKEIAETIS